MAMTRAQRLAKARQTRKMKKAKMVARMKKARASRKTKKVKRKVVRRTIYANNPQNRALGRVGMARKTTVCGCQKGVHKNRKHK